MISKAENSLLRNPFYLLGATTRDNQGRINELAEQRAMTLDPDLCRAARSDFANPRPRLPAELSWLPGVAPDRATEVAENLDRNLSKKGSELPPLARANAIAARIESGPIEEGQIVRTVLARIMHRFDELASGGAGCGDFLEFCLAAGAPAGSGLGPDRGGRRFAG